MSVEQMLQAAEAVARTAAVEAVGAEAVGSHQRAETDAAGAVSHFFEALQPGYRGWSWVVSLAGHDPALEPTVNDLVLLPGPDAIIAPAWTPYRDRVRPGDLSPGDVLPPEPDDLRLVPAWSAGDADTETVDRRAAADLAGGRTWVLSVEGRDMAAQRWHDGAGGPDTALAQQASGTCRTCGFRIGLAGPLADRFGVCANGMANDDGRVVDFQHGCGAHSGVKLRRSTATPIVPDPYFDTLTTDHLARPEPRPEPAVEPEAAVEHQGTERSESERVDPESVAPESVESDSADVVPAGDAPAEPQAAEEPVLTSGEQLLLETEGDEGSATSADSDTD